MSEAAALACAYVEGMSKSEFLSDKRTQQAVILNLMLIGEIATGLLRDHTTFLAEHPETPWREMR